jgi:hypothetical protein
VAVVRGAEVVGLVGEREVALATPSTVPGLGRHEWQALAERVRVAEVMDRRVIVVTSDASVDEVGRQLARSGARAAVVVEGEEVVGLASVRELLDVLANEVVSRWPSRLAHVIACVESSGAASVVATAVGLADRDGARLTVVHVLPALPRAAEGAAPLLAQRIRQVRRAGAGTWLASLLEAAVEGTAVGATTIQTVEGTWASAVEGASARADVVVAPPDIAGALMHRVPCPVLAVAAGGQ